MKCIHCHRYIQEKKTDVLAGHGHKLGSLVHDNGLMRCLPYESHEPYGLIATAENMIEDCNAARQAAKLTISPNDSAADDEDVRELVADPGV